MKTLTKELTNKLIEQGREMSAASDRADFILDDTAGIIAGLVSSKTMTADDFTQAVTPWLQGIDDPASVDDWAVSDRARKFKSRLKARLGVEFGIKVEPPKKVESPDAIRKAEEREQKSDRMMGHANKVAALAKREAIPPLLAAAQLAESAPDSKTRREILDAPDFAAKRRENLLKEARADVIAHVKACDDLLHLRGILDTFAK